MEAEAEGSDSEEQDQASEEDFFQKKEKEREESQDADQSDDYTGTLQVKQPILSKRKMRKIDMQGPYGGANVTVFTADGKAVPKSDLKKTNAYLDSLAKVVVIRDEGELSSGDEKAEKHAEKLKRELLKTKEADEKLMKDRLKAKRLKAK